MIKVFSGEDYLNRKKAYKDFTRTLKEKGDISFVVCEEDENTLDALERFIEGGGMFFGGVCVTIQDGLSSGKIKEKVESLITSLVDSPTQYIFIENTTLSKDMLKLFEKNKVEINEFVLPSKKEFNSFGATEAFLQKDKKKIWIEINKTASTGESAEALHGLLWWQIRSLVMISLGMTQTQTGLKDYPYNKTKKALSLFEKKELFYLSREFAFLPVVSRRKGISLYESMEEFFLKNF